MAILWPHDLKFRRAREHLKELEADVQRWVKVDGYSVAFEADTDPTEYVITAQIRRRLDENRLSVLVGDFLQNARAALDHLAFALADPGPDGEMGERLALASGFPIIGDVDSDGFAGRGGDQFNRAADKQLATIAPQARTAIERLQPYQEGTHWRSHSLWILNELARYDRHRFLHPVAVQTDFLEIDSSTTRNLKIKSIEVAAGRFVSDRDKYGAEIPTVIGRIIGEVANPKREVHVGLKMPALLVGFDADTLPPTVESVAGHEIDRVLRLIAFAVGDAIRVLSAYLPDESFLGGEPPDW